MGRRTRLDVVVRHPYEPRVLLLRTGGEWRLPRVRERNLWFADAEAVVRAVDSRLGARTWLVRQLSFDDHDESVVDAVVELELRDPDWRPPAHGRWADLEDVRRLGVEHGVLRRYLEDAERGEVPPERPPWARPGWRVEAEAWLAAEVASLGRRLVAVEQVKHWAISSVLRVRTDGPALYLKAPARLPLFAEEGQVTAALAERFPEYVPAPLAVEPERGWLLLPEVEPVGWHAPVEIQRQLLQRFARLQRDAASRVDELLALGCLERPLGVLERQFDALLGRVGTVSGIEPAEAAELQRRAPAFRAACRRLAELGPPPTLVHGDLHQANVAWLDGRLVYFDWTDACIAHPFVDLLSLRWVKDTAVRQELLDAYLAEWEGVASPARLREAAALAEIVILLHHAVSYASIAAAVEPVARPEVDATAEFLRDALVRLREHAAD